MVRHSQLGAPGLHQKGKEKRKEWNLASAGLSVVKIHLGTQFQEWEDEVDLLYL